jgi:hypothetical protein
MFRTYCARFGLIALLLVVTAGCARRSARVSGEVSYEGKPVGDGMISFLPADGKGPSSGGPITDGTYTVENLTPGPKIVKIEAVKAVPFARSSEEMARMAKENKARGDGSGLIDPADIIPANAEGNNTRVDIKTGKQTMDFHLKKPVGKKTR